MSQKSVDRGLIRRIYLKNFVTYDEVEIKPGRNLNLIIGANGTGKSTIVCGIVLGLGGKTSVIGRAQTIGEYVKAGKDSSEIRIELQDTGSKSITITRRFNKESSTSWLINDKPVNMKQIQELMKNMNIQVDNLCQFLPQDKVQDFSKLSPQELLIETERSVGDPKLLEYHARLKEFRSDLKKMEEDLESKNAALEQQKLRYDFLKEEVGQIKEKKAIKKKIQTLKQKKAWMQYEDSRRELVEARKGRDDAAQKMKVLDEKLKPFVQVISKLKAEIRTLEKSVKDQTLQVNAKTSRAKKILDDAEKYEASIGEAESTCDERIKTEQNRDEEINRNEQQKSKLDNDLQHMIAEFGTEADLKSEQQKVMPLMDAERNILNKLKNHSIKLKQQQDQFDAQIRGLERELQMGKNVQDKRLEMLRYKNQEAYKGVLWLRENQDKFSSPVHEPMFLNINIKDAKYSKYFENIIPMRDLVAFVCEDKRDMNLLLKYLRDQQGLKINAIHSDPYKQVHMTPNVPLSEIEHLGFEHYLISLIDAPAAIINYLVTMYRINDIPIGNAQVGNNLDAASQYLSRFFTPTECYSVSHSKYTGEKRMGQNRIYGSGMLAITLDTDKLHSINEQLTSIKTKKEQILDGVKGIDIQYKEVQIKVDEYRSIRNQCQQNIEQIQGLKSRINVCARKIENLKSERMSIELIKETYKNEIKTLIDKQLDMYNRYNVELENCIKSVMLNEELKLKYKFEQDRLAAKENDSQEMRNELHQAEARFKELDRELQPLKNQTQKLYNSALDSTDGIGNEHPGFTKIKTAFSKLPATIQDINDEIQNNVMKMSFLKGDEGQNTLREYENLKEKIEVLTKDLQARKDKLDNLTKDTENIREQWQPMLEDLVDRINTNFSKYFKEMKCAGEVSLVHGDNAMDYDKYGLKIRIKFRDADELQELTRHHQSGGERAVTTAVYMIALQELTRVPFRCVDEINQGMDAINEKRVFELIVSITGKKNSAQYFLLTPKLLHDLKYDSSVTVLTVFNGPFMIPHTEFDMTDYCAHVTEALGN